MLQSIRFPVLVLLFPLWAYGQPSYSPESNSFRTPHLLRDQLKIAEDIRTRINLLQRLSQYYIDKQLKAKPDLDTAAILATEAMGLSQSDEFSRGVGESHLLLMQVMIHSKDTFQLEKVESELKELLAGVPADTNKVHLLLGLSKHYLRWPSTDTSYSERAFEAAKEADRVSKVLKYIKGRAFAEKAYQDIHLSKSDFKSATDHMEQAIKLFIAIKNWAGAAECYAVMGDHYVYPFSKETMAIKSELHTKAMYYYRKAGDKAGMSWQCYVLAYLEILAANYESARKYAEEGLAMQLEIDGIDVGILHSQLAVIYEHLDNEANALSHAILAVKRSLITKDTANIYWMYMDISSIHARLGNRKEAIEYSYRALTNALTGSDNNYILQAASRVCSQTVFDRGEAAIFDFMKYAETYPAPERGDRHQIIVSYTLGNCLADLKQYDKAEKHLLEFAVKIKDHNAFVYDSEIMNAFQSLGAVYLAKKDYGRARYYLNEAIKLAETQGAKHTLSELELLQFKTDSITGKIADALKHFQKYHMLQKYLLDQKKNSDVMQLQLQYETEKKESDIKLLTEKAQLQESRLQQQTLIRNASIAGAGLFLLLLGVTFNRYKLKQKSNKQLQKKQMEINEKNETLQLLVDEKEDLLHDKDLLMREIHHRVKNNLQIIMSLLNTQTAYLKDDSALTAIRESQHRVYAMSLIHQKLYQSDDVALIDSRSYINDIVNHLKEGFEFGQNVIFEQKVDSIILDVSHAVPLGLIINEAVTNAIKHAFTGKRDGIISISLQKSFESVLLSIKDNGSGLPNGFNKETNQSLGMTLITGLAQQLNGWFRLESRIGVTVLIGFPVGPEEPRTGRKSSRQNFPVFNESVNS